MVRNYPRGQVPNDVAPLDGTGAVPDTNLPARLQPSATLLNYTTVPVDVPPFYLPAGGAVPINGGASNYIYVSGGTVVTYIGDICPGTWTGRFQYIKLTNLGIINLEYSFDNINWNTFVSGLDQYAAATTYLQYVDKVGIVVPAGAYTVYIRGTVIGKNASSSSTLFVMGQTSFIRTA